VTKRKSGKKNIRGNRSLFRQLFVTARDGNINEKKNQQNKNLYAIVVIHRIWRAALQRLPF
jgi:hypothetical protein